MCERRATIGGHARLGIEHCRHQALTKSFGLTLWYDRDGADHDQGHRAPLCIDQRDRPALDRTHQHVLFGTGTEAACNVHATPPRTESAVVENGRVRDVYVYIKRGHEGWIVPEPPAEPVTLSQEGCIYVPHALAVQTGQKLLVHNGDDTTHNVNMKAKRNGINGNYTQGRKQADLEFVFERREHLIPFKCDIHPWMGAQLYVQDHPWFALTDAEGNFNIEGVPPGDYTLEAVHETFGKLKADITVAAGSPATAAFSYTD